MTPEQRLDRLERMARLLVRARLRERTTIRKTNRDYDYKLNALLDAQIRSEDRIARNGESIARLEDLFTRNQQAIQRLVAAQAQTNEKLQTLIDSIRGKDLGESFA